ncbi:MAG: ABC transporter ATP-binding protein [Bacteroidales bacterium]|nr:ABC transporter ATP-binding protein [Bacteroidales bacterium]
MNNGKAIIIKGLSKEYYKKDSSQSGFFDKFKPNKSGQSFYALKDINLEINKGEVIGIIGPNGAGKSTLLKILAEVTPPTSGSVEIFGKVASILEIGIGFQPELSGYENIFLSGQLYGLSKKHILSKLDRIIEMFGFPDFINTEVKHYSSGMYMRLAFSIIINIEADIYLFDEILSVGDAFFQDKALSEIERLKNIGACICIVTHSPITIVGISDKFILLNKGSVLLFAEPSVVVLEYKRYFSSQNSIPKKNIETSASLMDEQILLSKKNLVSKTTKAIFDLTLVRLNKLNKNDNIFCCEDEFVVEIESNYLSDKDLTMALLIKDKYDTVIVSQTLSIVKNDHLSHKNIKIKIDANTFNESKYFFDIIILDFNDSIVFGYQNLIEVDFISRSSKLKNLKGYINLPMKIISTDSD